VRSLAIAMLLAAGAAAAPVADDIRDVRAPVAIPAPRPWALYGAGVLALALGGVAVLVRRRRRARTLSAHGRAFASLEEARALMEPARARAYGIAVSDAVRRYIEERFHVPASRRTTFEFLDAVSADPPALMRDHLAPLRELLGFSDRAKFGGWVLAQAEIEGMYACAWRFVDLTRAAEKGKRR